MIFELMEYEIDSSGKIANSRVTGEEFFPCDEVILAIGQEKTPSPGWKRDIGIEFDRWGVPGSRSGHLSMHPRRGLLRRRCGLWPGEHHLGGRTWSPGGHIHSQALPRRVDYRAHAAGHEPAGVEDGNSRVELLQRLRDCRSQADAAHEPGKNVFRKLDIEVELGFTPETGRPRGAALPELRYSKPYSRRRCASNATPAWTFARCTA